MQGFKAAVLPADASDSVARSFSELVVRPFYAEKYETHVVKCSCFTPFTFTFTLVTNVLTGFTARVY